jgi:hypothetical protein
MVFAAAFAAVPSAIALQVVKPKTVAAFLAKWAWLALVV